MRSGDPGPFSPRRRLSWALLGLALAGGGAAHAQQLPYAVPAQPALRTAPALSPAQTAQLRRMLAGAADEGLTPSTDTAAVATVPVSGQGLVDRAMEYARAVHSGRLRSDDYLPNWGLRPTAYDPWPSFVQAVAQNRLGAWIASLPPPYTGYVGLRRGLATYRGIAAAGGWPSLPAGSDLGIGASGARVLALRRRLAVEDRGTTEGAKFDLALAERVQQVQKRYGLKPNGIVNKTTLAALNVSVEARIRQIMANMERWRWLPAELPSRRIQVNIAAAVLTLFEAETPVTSMRAVTGRPGDETPMLHSQIHSVVLNPPWNVPNSIATKELWPTERKRPGYLRKNGFRVIETPEGGRRLQQRAGPQSSLGRVKFDFENPYGVYLHDTPTQGTFERYVRQASHGCVRLQRPVDLAKLLLRDDPAWAGEMVDAAIAAGDTVRAKLPEPIAVYLLYWTTFASGTGQMHFRADPYDWDALLAAKLDARAARPAALARIG